MILKHHKTLKPEKWFSLRLCEQMANIGSEVERTITWGKKGHRKYADLAFERALELADLTKEDPKNRKSLKEICRMREVLADWYFDNEYGSTDKSLQKYFYAFSFYARMGK